MTLRFRESRVSIPDLDVADLQQRIRSARWPARFTPEDSVTGTSLHDLQDLAWSWCEEYDWRVHEARLNSIDQLRTEVSDQPLHLVHQRSPHDDALPLLLMNGFPSSAYQWCDVVGPLTEPTAHGGKAEDAFHVIAPTLPGFTLSGPTMAPGWNPRRIADAYSQVLASLGYERYGIEASDFGSMVAMNLVDLDRPRVAGLHLSTVPVMRGYDRIERGEPPRGVDPSTLSTELRALLAQDAERWRASAPMRAVQQSQPQTLGVALEDSPVGMLAWFGPGQTERERRADICPDPGVTVSPREHFLTNVSLYWFTHTATSALRLYREVARAGSTVVPTAYVDVPTGIRMASDDVSHTPREWVAKKYHVTHWAEDRAGGHFAAADAPSSYVEDLRTFFAAVDRRGEP